MSNVILVCTNNLVPEILFKKVLMNAFIQADISGNSSVVVVSHYPVFEEHLDLDDPSLKKVQHKNFS